MTTKSSATRIPSAPRRAPTASPRASSRSSAGWRRTSPPHSRDSFPFCPTFRPTFRPTIRVPVVVVPRRRATRWRFRRAVVSSSPARETARRCAVGTSPPIGASTSRLACPARRSSRGRRAGLSLRRAPRRGIHAVGDGRVDERVVVHGRRARDGGGVGPAKRRRCGGVGHHARRRRDRFWRCIFPTARPRSPRGSSRWSYLAWRRTAPTEDRRRARRERRRHRGHVVGSLGETPGGGVRFRGGERCAREGTRRVIFGSNLARGHARVARRVRLRPGRRTPPPEGRADTRAPRRSRDRAGASGGVPTT